MSKIQSPINYDNMEIKTELLSWEGNTDDSYESLFGGNSEKSETSDITTEQDSIFNSFPGSEIKPLI